MTSRPWSGRRRARRTRWRAAVSLIALSAALAGCGGETVSPTVNAPNFDPPAGFYTSPQHVSILASTPGSILRYTTDGSDPTEASAEFTNPVLVEETTTLRARAWREGWQPSEIANGLYEIEFCSPCLLSPDGGEIWVDGSAHQVEWEPTPGTGPAVRIELLRHGSLCLTIADSTANDGSEPWIVHRCGDATDDYRIRVTDLATGDNDESDGAFRILAPCGITVLRPNGEESWVAGTLHEITWDPTGTCGAYVEIELLRAGVLCGTIAAAAQNRGSYAWTAAQCEDYPDHYSVRVTDAASGARDESDRTFQIPSACSVSLLSPNGFESWPEGTVHDITWSRTGICSFVRIELLRLGIACKTIAYSTDNDGRYTWVVDRCLDYADQYTVRITDLATGAMDVSSQPFTIPARLPAAPGESRPE